ANLDALPPRGAWVTLAPMKLEGGTGAPARVLAFVPVPASKREPVRADFARVKELAPPEASVWKLPDGTVSVELESPTGEPEASLERALFRAAFAGEWKAPPWPERQRR